MVKNEAEAPPPVWPEGAFVKEEPCVKEEEAPPAWPEGAIVKEEMEEPPVRPEGAIVKQEQQEQQVQHAQHELHALQANPGPPAEANPAQQCSGHGCELARFHEGLCTSQQVVGPRQRRPSERVLEGQSLQIMALRDLGHRLAKGTREKRAAPLSEDSDGVDIESEEGEEAEETDEGQNGATPAGQWGGHGCKLTAIGDSLVAPAGNALGINIGKGPLRPESRDAEDPAETLRIFADPDFADLDTAGAWLCVHSTYGTRSMRTMCA